MLNYSQVNERSSLAGRDMADSDDLFLFHNFLLDRRGGGLFRRDGNGGLTPVPIGARALDVLGALLERAGDVITRDEIIARYRRVWAHSDATIDALPIDAPGYVPWWPRPNVKLFNIMVHVLTDPAPDLLRPATNSFLISDRLERQTKFKPGAKWSISS